MTTFVFDDIQKKTDARLNLVRMDTDKATEESKESLEKIRRRFYDDILFPKLMVKGIRSKQELSSFRIGRHQQINLDIKMNEEVDIAALARKSADLLYGTADVVSGSADLGAETLGAALESDSSLDLDMEESTDGVDGQKEGDMSAKNLTSHSRARQMDAGNLDAKVVKALKKQEEKREKRAGRKKEWQELYVRKPKEGEEDPVLVEEIRQARENVGMYTRKNGLEYEELSPIRFENHRKELIMLLHQIRQAKEQFNEEVLGMKTRKEALLAELEDISLKLIDIQYRLDASKRKPVPTIPVIYPEEMHTDPFHINEKDVDMIKIGLQQEEEQRFLQGGSRMSISSRRSSISSVSSRLKGGSRMGRQKDQPGQQSAAEKHAAKKKEREKDRSQALADISKLGTLGALTALAFEEEEEEEEEEVVDDEDRSETEVANQNSFDIRYETEQNAMIKRMESSTRSFDQDLQKIIERKKELSVNLKYAELTILTMYEELQVVRSTQATEDDLKKQVKELGRAVTDVDQLVAHKEGQLVKRTKAVQRANDQLKSIQEHIENELADNKHSEYLLRLFAMRDSSSAAKAMPTNKAASTSTVHSEKKVAATATNDELASSKTIYVEGLKTELKTGTDDLKHPDDIDQDALKLVMDLRAKRDGIEANVKDEEAAILNLNRELSQAKVQRTTQRSLHAEAIDRAQNYSAQKRTELNEICTVVNLCKDQLKLAIEKAGLTGTGTGPGTEAQSQSATAGPTPRAPAEANVPKQSVREHSIGGKDEFLLSFPTDPEAGGQDPSGVHDGTNVGDLETEEDPLLIFSEDNLKQLQRRTEELKTERAMQKNKFKEDRQEYLNLQSDCKELSGKIKKLDTQCSVEMVKRFGEGVSMTDIESFAVNKTLEEMKEVSKRKEQSLYLSISKTTGTIKEDRTKLRDKTKSNTELIIQRTENLSELNILAKSKERDEEMLKKADDKILQDAKDEHELVELKQMYRNQEAQIQDMRNRLARFMTKGAPILPPPRPFSRRISNSAPVHINRPKKLSISTRGAPGLSTTSHPTTSGSGESKEVKSYEEVEKDGSQENVPESQPEPPLPEEDKEAKSEVMGKKATAKMLKRPKTARAAEPSSDKKKTARGAEDQGGLVVRSTRMSMTSTSSSVASSPKHLPKKKSATLAPK